MTISFTDLSVSTHDRLFVLTLAGRSKHPKAVEDYRTPGRFANADALTSSLASWSAPVPWRFSYETRTGSENARIRAHNHLLVGTIWDRPFDSRTQKQRGNLINPVKYPGST